MKLGILGEFFRDIQPIQSFFTVCGVVLFATNRSLFMNVNENNLTYSDVFILRANVESLVIRVTSVIIPAKV